MLKSNAPVPYTIPWANAGTKNTIPVASQIGITNGAASFTDGYPPLTFTPIASGGVPPFGADTNGILYDETLNTLWQQAGFMYAYSSTFSTNQGGYPAQSVLMRSDGKGLWLNLADSNTTNPDATGATNWTAIRSNVGSSSITVANGTNTPDASLLGPRLLVITGSISSTATLILPLTAGSSWIIQNSTTGAGTLNVSGSTGTGVTVAQGTVSEVVTDGTNYYTSTFNGAGVYLPIAGTAVAATKLATARTIAMTGDVSWTSPAFDGTANVTAAGTIAANAVTLAKMANFQANSLMGNPTGSTATPSAITLASPLTFSGTTLALSYTPVNKAGDTMAGALIFSATQGLGVQFARGDGVGSEIWRDTSATDLWYFDQKTNSDIIFRTGGTTEQFRVKSTGGVTASSYNTSSDETLKSGIERHVEPRDLSAVPYATWTHLRGLAVKGRGSIAQDMQKVAPEHVHEDSNGKLGIDYSLAAYEQAMFNRKKIGELEARIASLGG